MNNDEKRYDGVDALSRVSGVPREEVLKLWDQVQQNRDRLAACAGPHDFVRHDKREFRCTRCSGTVTITEQKWYQLGLEHAKLSVPE